MKRLILALMLAFATISYTQAQITTPTVEHGTDTDAKYQKGAIPVVNGHATMTRVIDVAEGLSGDALMQRLDVWIQRCMRDDRIRFNQRLKHTAPLEIQQSVVFELTFAKSFLAHDFTDMSYVILLDAGSQPGKVVMTMTRIAFKYDEAGTINKYTAEEIISDEVAFNKKGRIIFGYRKFRLKTIDLMDELAASLTTTLQ